jgi:hypothetical protein
VGHGTGSILTSKGQATIPRAIRDSLRMKTGDRMTPADSRLDREMTPMAGFQ